MDFRKEDFTEFKAMYGKIYWSKKHQVFISEKQLKDILNGQRKIDSKKTKETQDS